jgi:hypothetical protein
MSDQEFHFLEEYVELCKKYNIIITTEAEADPPYICQVMTCDIPLHIGHLFCFF